MTRQETVICEESEGSNKKSSKEKLKGEPAKVPEPEEDLSIPETQSEKIYKVKSVIILPHQEIVSYLYIAKISKAIILYETEVQD